MDQYSPKMLMLVAGAGLCIFGLGKIVGIKDDAVQSTVQVAQPIAQPVIKQQPEKVVQQSVTEQQKVVVEQQPLAEHQPEQQKVVVEQQPLAEHQPEQQKVEHQQKSEQQQKVDEQREGQSSWIRNMFSSKPKGSLQVSLQEKETLQDSPQVSLQEKTLEEIFVDDAKQVKRVKDDDESTARTLTDYFDEDKKAQLTAKS